MATEHRVVLAEPGSTVELVVDVVNTGDLIDGITANLIGLPGAKVEVEPKVLPLFPSAQGQIRLSVEVPTTQPAGSHPVTVEVVSHGAGEVSQHVDIDLSVSARPAVRLVRTPQLVRARRTGRFVVEVHNTGNTALDVALDATREDTRTGARFTPRTMRVEPGVSAPAIFVLKGPRMITGAELDRTASINLTARRTNVISAMQEAEQEPELTASTLVTLKQRPILSRGLLTACVLLLIVGLWAAVFLLGLTQVLGGDPLTKTAPPSFFPVSAEPAAGAAGAGADGEASGDAAAAAAAEPAGAMSKDGLVPAGVGGSISGVVTAASNQAPVGQILVEAFRDGRRASKETPVSAAATQADGSYALAGLFPTSYRLRFSAEGFDEVWYPAAPNRKKAEQVKVVAQQDTEPVSVVVTGQPAQITGTVDQGSSLTPIDATVTARPLDILTPDGQPSPVVAEAAAVGGSYTLTGLPAPATYELSIIADGYAVRTVTIAVSGGEERLQPSVVPSAAAGVITGRVTDGSGTGIGGVTVSTVVDGEAISVITPTVGDIGAYTLGGLPTPAAYVVTFSAPGHGSTTEIVDLDAGASAERGVALIEGTGSVSGRVQDPDGDGLGGATVTVGGATVSAPTTTSGTATEGATAVVPTTTTHTGAPGAPATGGFSLGGLEAPGEYTLTVSVPGFAPQTIPFALDGSGPGQPLVVTLTQQLGSLGGAVLGPGGAGLTGATVTATDGLLKWTATSGDQVTRTDPALGRFQIGDLPPGSYSVTVTAAGMRPRTALVRVFAGVRSQQVFRLEASS